MTARGSGDARKEQTGLSRGARELPGRQGLLSVGREAAADRGGVGVCGTWRHQRSLTHSYF